MTDDLPDIDLSEYAEAFRELDGERETVTLNPSNEAAIVFCFRYERRPAYHVTGDWLKILKELPEPIREAVEHLGNLVDDLPDE